MAERGRMGHREGRIALTYFYFLICKHTCTLTSTYTSTHTHACMHTHSHTYAHTHTHMHIHTHIHTCMHTHKHTHTHTDTHIHTHIHTPGPPSLAQVPGSAPVPGSHDPGHGQTAPGLLPISSWRHTTQPGESSERP